MSVRLPTATHITSLQLSVFDAGGRCEGPDATGGNSLLVTELELGVPRTLTISSGSRTFSVIAFDGTAVAARGCAQQNLVAGGVHQIDITLAPYGDDPDAGVPDAMEPDAAEPNVCDTPGTLVVGMVESGTLQMADDLQGSCGGAGGTEAVYEVVLATEARLKATVTRTSGDFDPVVYLRETCLAPATEVANGCANEGSGATEVLDLDRVPAGTYYLIVDGVGVTPGDFDLLVELLPVPPTNDRCAGATAIGAGVAVSGTTVDARDDTAGACGTGGEDVFYTFTLASSRRVVIDLTNATSAHSLFVQETCGDSQTELGCTTTAAGAARLDLLALGAGTYTIVAEATEQGGGTFDLVYQTFDPVPNDSCDDPIVLSPGSTSSNDSSIGALDDEAGSCGGAGVTPDIIYSYTLAQPRRVELTVTSDYDAAVSVRTAACVSEAAELTCTDAVAGAGTETVSTRNQPAGTYYVVVDGVGGATGHADVTLTTSAPPLAGDWCPEVVTLPVGTLNAQSLTASYADDSSASCGGIGGADRVYEFTFFGERQVDIDVVGNVDHVAYLVSGTCDGGTEESCQAAILSGTTYSSNINFSLLPGGTYYVVVDAASPGGAGLFDITLALQGAVQPPPNDTCAAAATLTAGLSASGTLDAAADDSNASCSSGVERDAFYTFSLTSSRAVTVVLNSSQDTALRLMSDCTTELACVEATATGEQLDLPVLTAGTYYLAVDGVDGAAGGFTIGYTTGAPRPANDHCAGAVLLTDGVALTGETTSAALDDHAGSCGGAGGGDVSYRFTVPPGANRRARVTATNAVGFDPVVVLRDSSCTGAELVCGQTSTGTTEVVDAPDLPPGDYVVWVDALGSGGGTFDIVLELMTAVLPPANDTCTAPDALVAGVIETHSTVGAVDDYALACLAFDSRDATHQIELASAQATLVTLTPQAPGWQLAAALRASADCTTGPELSCASEGGGVVRINQPNLPGGTYALVVDGESGATGDYDVGYETRPVDTTFGYWQIVTAGTFTSIAGTAGATQRTIPLSTTGLSPGDEWSQNISLPFTFDYYGTSYTSVNAHSNTFLTFDVPPAGAESYNNDCPLDSTAPNNLIALFWGDGISTLAAGSEMWTRVDGVMPDRRLIIEYKSWDMVTCSGPNCYLLDTRMSQQAVLYENGDVEFRYGPRTDPGGDKGCGTEHTGCASTIGIEGQVNAATDIDAIECDVDNTTNGRVIYFVHPR